MNLIHIDIHSQRLGNWQRLPIIQINSLHNTENARRRAKAAAVDRLFPNISKIAC